MQLLPENCTYQMKSSYVFFFFESSLISPPTLGLALRAWHWSHLLCAHSFERLFSSLPSLVPRLLWALLFHFYFCNPSHRAGLLSSALPALWLYCSVGFSLLSVTTAVRGQSSGSCEMSHSSDTGQQTYSNYCNNIRNTCFKTLPWKTISFLSDMLPNVCTVFLSVFFFFSGQTYCVFTCWS